jgi:hypothetical protein
LFVTIFVEWGGPVEVAPRRDGWEPTDARLLTRQSRHRRRRNSLLATFAVVDVLSPRRRESGGVFALVVSFVFALYLAVCSKGTASQFNSKLLQRIETYFEKLSPPR